MVFNPIYWDMAALIAKNTTANYNVSSMKIMVDGTEVSNVTAGINITI